MDAPGRWVRGALCLVLACGTSARDPTRLEAAIAADLRARLGVVVVTRCGYEIPMCRAQLADGTQLPIEVTLVDGSYEWRVRGLLVTTGAIERYLAEELGDLGAPQGARCLPQVRAIAPGERLACALDRGGTAFVAVRADGTTTVEVALDPAAAAARAEVLTPERERDLESASRALADRGDEGDDEGDDESDDESDEPR